MRNSISNFLIPYKERERDKRKRERNRGRRERETEEEERVRETFLTYSLNSKK